MSTAFTPCQWYFSKDRQKHGPVPFDQLQAMAAGKSLLATDMVLQAGTTSWQQAGTVPGLFGPPVQPPVALIVPDHAIAMAPAAVITSPSPPATSPGSQTGNDSFSLKKAYSGSGLGLLDLLPVVRRLPTEARVLLGICVGVVVFLLLRSEINPFLILGIAVVVAAFIVLVGIGSAAEHREKKQSQSPATPQMGDVPLVPPPQPVVPAEYKKCPFCAEPIRWEAVFCRFCQKEVPASQAVPVYPSSVTPHGNAAAPSQPNESLGIIALLIPLAGAMLNFFWIGNMNLLQGPGNSLAMVVVLSVVSTSILIGVEANQLGIGGPSDPRVQRGKNVTGAVGWAVLSLLIWIVGYPCYMYHRSRFGVKNMLVAAIGSALVFVVSTKMMNDAIESKKAEIRRILEH